MSKETPEDQRVEVAPGTVPSNQGKKRKRKSPKPKEETISSIKQRSNKVFKFDDAGETITVAPNVAEKIPETQRERGTSTSDDKIANKRIPQTLNSKAKINDAQTSERKQKGNSFKPKHSALVPPHLLKRRDALLPVRKALPIWSQAAAIKSSLKKNNVLVLTGETGSGKSTQVPQFLASEPWCTKCIAITQPRRVAAISLARRVSEEMGTFMGSQSPTAKVGYNVRFDNATGPSTKIKYLTEGMLLQEMLRDPAMSQYSAIVVDEVHERSVNVDLILGFLKKLIDDIESGGETRKHPLKIVVMSATADVESLVTFFEDSQGSPPSTTSLKVHRQISTCFVEGRQYPVKTVYLPEPTQDWVESALKIIFQIHYKEPLPGDILVFLTGQDTIEGLEKLVNDYAEGMDKDVPKLLTLPLFAALPQQAQQQIFQPTPYRTRKVILATNIAETSVTVPGVRYVVDCGKSKIKQFRNRLGLESLLVKPISKSAAIQRQGRAGREAAGHCYRLYTQDGFKTMDERTTPEILRCDLSQAILTMKARGVNNVINFPFLDRPPREALEKALLQLLHLQALSDDGIVTEVGLKMAKFPLTPTLGRVLVEAAKPERDCLLDVIDIISALSVENVFLNLVTEERKEEAAEARRELYRREGDHLTLLVTVRRYAEEQTDRKQWCEKHFVSHRAMQNVMNIRKQLQQQCTQLKLLTPGDEPDSSAPSEARSQAILQCMLRGFISNTARLMPDGSYKTLMGNQTVAIHPSSVLFGRKVEAIVFNEFLFTGKAWARGVSAVQLDWVSEVVEAIM
ncbi:ATP-dependent RNA helicase-like protein [Paraphoma chrysanthemicola]|uniref:RNA helicase n=1 Tax=Paraphoma chrysanthemicola TaxID=798071 RepID=A0A8K0RHF7_9PLEO|nr:ATP-dependent RNA helicase-like protein [Paraphoma chrysanthemicola]